MTLDHIVILPAAAALQEGQNGKAFPEASPSVGACTSGPPTAIWGWLSPIPALWLPTLMVREAHGAVPA